MTERGTDIEFDFFDEPETQEGPGRSRVRPAVRRPSGRRPPVRPPGGFTPLLRLVGLIAFGIVLVVVLVFWISNCRAESKRDTYREYMESMRVIATDSESVGRDLNEALTTPGVKAADLQETLGGLAQQQEEDVVRARNLDPPGRLREQHEEAIEALQFRVGGLRELQDAVQQASTVRQVAQVGGLLAGPMRRLLASDVIWDEQFVQSSRVVMEGVEIRGIAVPDSTFLANTDIVTERALTQVWQRIAGASTGGRPAGRHGNALVSVKAVPGGEVLQRDEENFVVATADLAFEVTIENSGEFQEAGVKVLLTVQQTPQPIRKEQTVDIIDPGDNKTVVFRDLGQVVQFAQKTTVKVEVAAVPSEERLDNNSASYSVTFTLT